MADRTPLEIPVPTRPTAEVLDTLFYEIVEVNKSDYVRLPYGSEHPNTKDYAGFKLVKEESLDYPRSRRWWANTPVNQDQYNYGISYVEEAIAYPIFTRRYLERRDTYTARAKGLPFKGVYLIQVTNGGANYTPDNPPTVTVSGGGGSGCTARAVVNPSGAVAWIVLVAEGDNFTSTPGVAFAGGGGAGAAATAKIQLPGCVLAKEKTIELGEDPRASLYLAVERTYETFPGPVVPGQTYEPGLDLIIPFTEQFQNTVTAGGSVAATGQARTDITPLDAYAAHVRVYAPPTAALNSYAFSVAGYTRFNLPSVLQQPTITYNKSAGVGLDTETGNGVSVGTSSALTLSLQGSGQGTASTIPEVLFDITEIDSSNVPSVRYFFYLSGNITLAAILAKLTTLAGDTVNAWPVFKPRAHSLVLKGMQVSINGRAHAQQHAQLSDSNLTYSYGTGTGVSRDHSLSVKVVRIPPTIHPAFTLTGDTDTALAYTTASATITGGTNWPARSATTGLLTETASASVTPNTLPASSGLTAIPTSGLYLHDLNVDRFKWGYSLVSAEVVDFAFFA